MPSTYASNSGIELIATGEQSGTWGTTTNTNLQIIDRLTNGVGAISLSGTTHTLTTSNGTLSDGQYSVLVFGGSPSGTNTVTISPNDAQHVYFVKNSSGESVVLTQGSGGNVTIANGDSKIVYADGAGAGAAVVDITADFAMSSVNITGGSITGITDLAVADGGTGISTVPTNGQLLIGNGTNYTAATLTAGTGISVTNGSGTVTVAATNNGTVTSVSGTGTKNGLTLTGTVTTSGSLTLGGTLAISNADWSGADLAVTNGGTGVSTVPTNGQLLIGNGTGYTVAALTAGTGISVTNGSGTVTVAATNNGTVTSVSGTGNVNGITLTGTVTSSGSLTLGGTLSNVNLTSQVTGTLPVANGGSGAASLTGILVGNGTSAFTTVTAPSGTVVGSTDTQTLTNKRINPRVVAASGTSGTITPNGDTTDVYKAEGLTGGITIAAPSGTPVDGQKLLIRLEDNGTARAITWTTSAGAFREMGITLPITTVATKITYVGCIYNATDSFWDAVATVTQA